MFECWGWVGVWMGVGCPCPPVRNDIVTPRHLFTSATLELICEFALELAAVQCPFSSPGRMRRDVDILRGKTPKPI